MSEEEIEPVITAPEQAKTVYALDYSSTVNAEIFIIPEILDYGKLGK
jgi:hypothetical protein